MDTEKLLEIFENCTGVNTDTRKLQAGEMFFALKGPNFDGNRYAAKALESGAAYVVIDDPAVEVQGDDRFILVQDSLKALQDLSRARREGFDFPVIGITGSNGKTTTKELIHAVLSREKRCYATKGNLNNHIGVPLTLLDMPSDTEIAIIEMGANQPGDIKELAEIALPTHGLITNIGMAHLERFRDLDGVQKTKGELFDFLRAHHGHAFLNEADSRVRSIGMNISACTTYGLEDSDYQMSLISDGIEGLNMTVTHSDWQEALPIRTQLSGSYNASNILVAALIGDHFGISKAAIQQGVHAYVPQNNRSQLIQQGNTIIYLDAYNANPSSMRSAIQNVLHHKKNHSLLVLGDMFELGQKAADLHRDIGLFLNQQLGPNEIDAVHLIGIGPLMQHAVQAYEGPGAWFEDVSSANEQVLTSLKKTDIALIKGSRGMALEQLLEVS